MRFGQLCLALIPIAAAVVLTGVPFRCQTGEASA